MNLRWVLQQNTLRISTFNHINNCVNIKRHADDFMFTFDELILDTVIWKDVTIASDFPTSLHQRQTGIFFSPPPKPSSTSWHIHNCFHSRRTSDSSFKFFELVFFSECFFEHSKTHSRYFGTFMHWRHYMLSREFEEKIAQSLKHVFAHHNPSISKPCIF